MFRETGVDSLLLYDGLGPFQGSREKMREKERTGEDGCFNGLREALLGCATNVLCAASGPLTSSSSWVTCPSFSMVWVVWAAEPTG
jgi:hypothetical protein